MNKNSLYDSYVTSAGWLNGAAKDGLRKSFVSEFSEIYVFNLRGNQRTQGETSRREGGKIFGSGSRAPIAVTVFVRNPEIKGAAQVFYRDIGEYLSREEKLGIVSHTPDVFSDEFDSFIPLGDKRNPDNAQTFFCRYYTNGVKTQRDVWAYNFSRPALELRARVQIQRRADCRERLSSRLQATPLLRLQP